MSTTTNTTICRHEMAMKRLNRYRWGAALFFGIPAALFMSLAITQLLRDLALDRSEQIAEASVTDWKSPGRKDPGHSIRYTFVVDGAEANYSDSTGRQNLWVQIPEPVWGQTKVTRTISVRYVPGNIKNNAPACNPVSLANSLGILALGFLSMVLAVAIWWRSPESDEEYDVRRDKGDDEEDDDMEDGKECGENRNPKHETRNNPQIPKMKIPNGDAMRLDA